MSNSAPRRRLKAERPDHTVSATALVHEAYQTLAGPRQPPWESRAQFHAAAIEAMRRVLLDHAKGRGRLIRGGPDGSATATPERCGRAM